jgi:hypothetical protein
MAYLTKLLLAILIFFVFAHKVNANYDQKKVREEVDHLQLEIVKMSIQFSKTLKQKTGKGLEV